MKEVRTRFAPSPTGLLHIGGVRTALFEILLAHHYNGTAILRIDDTDRERLVPGAVDALIADLQWVGLIFDEGPYPQSERLPRYKEVSEELIRTGCAYRCDCSAERLAAERDAQTAAKEPLGYSGYCRDRNVSADVPHVVRFKIPVDREVVLEDAVKGEVRWERVQLRDTVLLKSDGYPTYHLATVVDDHDMRISHILRADEWLSTAPLHLLIFEAMQWETPVFAHLPPVLGPDGKKLSKRHGATFLSTFREAGYLPEAILNFMALIGWSVGEGAEEEIFSLDELTRRFTLERVNNAGGVFSYDKLNWMNGIYIRKLSPEELQSRVTPFLAAAGLSIDEAKLRKIIPHIQPRLTLLADATAMVDFLFKDAIERDIPAMLKKGMDAPKAREICLQAAGKLATLGTYDAPSIEAAMRGIAEEAGGKSGPVFNVIRIAVTGKTVTPPLFESMYALGQAESVVRLRETAGLLG